MWFRISGWALIIVNSPSPPPIKLFTFLVKFKSKLYLSLIFQITSLPKMGKYQGIWMPADPLYVLCYAPVWFPSAFHPPPYKIPISWDQGIFPLSAITLELSQLCGSFRICCISQKWGWFRVHRTRIFCWRLKIQIICSMVVLNSKDAKLWHQIKCTKNQG